MKLTVCLLVFVICFIGSEVAGFENFLTHPLYPCIQCLCHARTGCWRRQNCASYSISQSYWETAGSLVVDKNDNPNEVSSYNKCMQDENCIVGTIIKYTESFGKMDCNCDGKFDCKDRLAIHLKGANCESPEFGYYYATRFNHCAAKIGVGTMLEKEGDDQCTAPEVV